MSEDTEFDVRINVIVPREANDRINKLLPRGTKAEVIRKLVMKMLDQLEGDVDGMFVAALLRGNVDLVNTNEHS